MSLINKMLQDLDRRHAAAAGEDEPPLQVRPIPAAAQGGHEWFWRVFAGLMMIAVAWVLWIAYHLQPRTLATDAAFAAADAARSKATTAAAAEPVAQPLPDQARAPTAPMETFKLAGQISGEIQENPRAASPRAEAVTAAKQEAGPAAKAETRPAAEPAPAKLGLDLPQARILAAPIATAKVEKRDRTRSPAERAEAEFRRAVMLLNQGRVSEAEEGLAAALAADISHEAARQALIALHLEKRHTDEARRLLQEGLTINPRQQQFAAVLARILIEGRDYAAALDQIGRSLELMPGNPDLLLLRGAAQQRLGRHREAAAAYDASLRIAPQSGSGWLGLAISLEALDRRTAAAEAYRRAVATGTLSAEARDYAEQRARAAR